MKQAINNTNDLISSAIASIEGWSLVDTLNTGAHHGSAGGSVKPITQQAEEFWALVEQAHEALLAAQEELND